MSSLPSYYHDLSIEKCQWCFRQTNLIQKGKYCKHIICNKCIITDANCQSDCPLCWNDNITQFIDNNKICSGKKNIFTVDRQPEIVSIYLILIRRIIFHR